MPDCVELVFFGDGVNDSCGVVLCGDGLDLRVQVGVRVHEFGDLVVGYFLRFLGYLDFPP